MAIVENNYSGRQTVHRFENGFGASVISDGYGSTSGLFEVAVIQFTETSWNLVYSTPITDDVLGYLTAEDVAATLAKIEALDADLPEWSPSRVRTVLVELERLQLIRRHKLTGLTPRGRRCDEFEAVIS